MSLSIYTKSIQDIPRTSGFIWVKAKNTQRQTITVWTFHSCNAYETVRLKKRDEWLKDDLTDYWVEILLDKDVLLSA